MAIEGCPGRFKLVGEHLEGGLGRQLAAIPGFQLTQRLGRLSWTSGFSTLLVISEAIGHTNTSSTKAASGRISEP